MKAVQILFDEALLHRLDADEEVKRLGRSAVMRRAVTDYLRRRRTKRISDAYSRAYTRKDGLGEDFAGWEHEGAWPDA